MFPVVDFLVIASPHEPFGKTISRVGYLCVLLEDLALCRLYFLLGDSAFRNLVYFSKIPLFYTGVNCSKISLC